MLNIQETVYSEHQNETFVDLPTIDIYGVAKLCTKLSVGDLQVLYSIYDLTVSYKNYPIQNSPPAPRTRPKSGESPPTIRFRSQPDYESLRPLQDCHKNFESRTYQDRRTWKTGGKPEVSLTSGISNKTNVTVAQVQVFRHFPNPRGIKWCSE